MPWQYTMAEACLLSAKMMRFMPFVGYFFSPVLGAVLLAMYALMIFASLFFGFWNMRIMDRIPFVPERRPARPPRERVMHEGAFVQSPFRV